MHINTRTQDRVSIGSHSNSDLSLFVVKRGEVRNFDAGLGTRTVARDGLRKFECKCIRIIRIRDRSVFVLPLVTDLVRVAVPSFDTSSF